MEGEGLWLPLYVSVCLLSNNGTSRDRNSKFLRRFFSQHSISTTVDCYREYITCICVRGDFYQTLQLFSLVDKSTNRIHNTHDTLTGEEREREGEEKFPSLTFPPLQGIFSKEIFLVASKERLRYSKRTDSSELLDSLKVQALPPLPLFIPFYIAPL